MKRSAGRPTDREAQDEARSVAGALSHPLRVRILGWLRHQPPSTQSEVGKALGLSNAAARYHLKTLEGADLVSMQATRPGPNGITEKLYAANSEVWKRISDQPDRLEKHNFMLDYTFASMHEIHRKAVDAIKAGWGPPFVAGSIGAFATPAESEELRTQLGALLEQFAARHQAPEAPGALPLAITFAVLPSSPTDAQTWAGERIFDWRGEG